MFHVHDWLIRQEQVKDIQRQRALEKLLASDDEQPARPTERRYPQLARRVLAGAARLFL